MFEEIYSPTYGTSLSAPVMIHCMLSAEKKFWDRHGAIEGPKKAVRFSLVGPEGKVELGCFWRVDLRWQADR